MKKTYQHITNVHGCYNKDQRIPAVEESGEDGRIFEFSDLFPEQARSGDLGRIIVTVSFEPDQDDEGVK